MARIPQSFLDDLLNRVDIVEIIDHRVKLKRSGKNYSACCPFHDEKTPSFTVSPDKQFYYCFGCGANGTALSFLMEYDRSSFVDAVESLAKTAGVEVPREESRHDDAREKLRKRCYNILEKAAEHFEYQLKNNPQRNNAVEYLQNRGLSGHIAKAYGMGFAPPGWDNLSLKLGQTEAEQSDLIESGLMVENHESKKRYDRFRNRIMFPIRDGRGRVIGFGGRVLGDDKPKYLNSPETPVFSKGRELYGLYEAKKHIKKLEKLIVVEGYMDVIALAQYGLWNAVATLGTACGEEHLKIAFRHVSEVVFCFDGDNAGRSAAKRALLNSLSSMEDGRQIRFLFLAEGQDPDSLIRQIGAERFTQQLERALPLEDFLFDVAAEGIDLNSMDGRARFSKIAAPLIHQLPEGIFKSLMFDNLAKRTGLSSQILSEFTQLPEEIKQIAAEAKHAEVSANLPEKLENPVDQDQPSFPEELDNHYNSVSSDEFESAPMPDYMDVDYGVGQREALSLQPALKAHKLISKVALSPTKIATILLLDHPQLLQDSEVDFGPSDIQLEDIDVQNLNDLINYLRKRPDANFNNIMGFWGGAKGVEAQQAMAKLVATEIFSALKTIDSYDALKEFEACMSTLNTAGQRMSTKEELAKLNAKGLNQLNADEKKRYLALIQSV